MLSQNILGDKSTQGPYPAMWPSLHETYAHCSGR